MQYSLPPDQLQRAIEYAHARYWLHFIGAFYNIAIPIAILAFGVAAKFRDWAQSVSGKRFVQAMVFVPLLAITVDVVNLPLGIYAQHLELKYDQSIQSWMSWTWDWSKMELLGWLLAIPLAFLLNTVMRRSPRRWWFYFWLVALPILFVIVFLMPLVIEPLFFQFEPLSAKHSALVTELERVSTKGGLAIPPDRMFEMKASEKLRSLNAYVTGLGASKRVVVWDTTLEKCTTGETLFIFGHEMGHYVLGHILNSLILASLFALLLLYVVYRAVHYWRIEVTDWAAIPALLAIVAVLSFLSEPITNGYSRWQEHQADVFGLNVIRGIVPNSDDVAAHAFQVLGEVGLDEPNPPPFIKFWLFDHPSISDRVAFTHSGERPSGRLSSPGGLARSTLLTSRR
jgi:STE24 endopeptidase